MANFHHQADLQRSGIAHTLHIESASAAAAAAIFAGSHERNQRTCCAIGNNDTRMRASLVADGFSQNSNSKRLLKR